MERLGGKEIPERRCAAGKSICQRFAQPECWIQSPGEQQFHFAEYLFNYPAVLYVIGGLEFHKGWYACTTTTVNNNKLFMKALSYILLCCLLLATGAKAQNTIFLSEGK